MIIDPQHQAFKFLKTHLKKLIISQQNEKNFFKNLESCMQYGAPLLIENFDGRVDPILYPILLNFVFKKGNSNYMKLGDQDI